MKNENKHIFLLNVACTATVACLVVLVFKYFLWWLLPLVLGFCISFVLRPLVNAVYKISTATRRFCAVVVLVFAYSTLGVVVWFCVVQLVAGFRWLFLGLPAFYGTTLSPVLEQLNSQVLTVLGRFMPEVSLQLEEFSAIAGEQVTAVISSLSDRLIASVSDFVRGIPAFMLTFLFTVLSSFFISMDYNTIVSFCARLVPKRHRQTLFVLKDFFVSTVLKYIRAYALLLSLTFIEVWVGLALLRVPSSGMWALIIAVADLLPAIGTGLILLPWALLALLQGNKFLCVGILAIYGVVTVVRNIIEPKIVGDNIGLSPLATITAMFLGLKIFGLSGLFVMPMLVLTLKFLNDSGRLQLWEKASYGKSKQ